MESKDLIRRFIDEWCELGTRHRVPIGEIYDAFVHWCRIRRLEAASKAAFGRILSSLGYAAGRNGRERFRTGLRLARPGSLTAGGKIKVPDVPVVTPEGRPEPPSYLSASAAAWWRRVEDEYELEEHHLRLLTLAAGAWDRVQTAREIIDREGTTIVNNHGNTVLRPEAQLEQRASVVFSRLLRELGLGDDDESDGPRLPRPAGSPHRRK